MRTETKHTPTIKLERSNDGMLCLTILGVVIAHIKDYAEADAAFIVHACNAHEELLEALKESQKLIEELFKRNVDPEHSMDWDIRYRNKQAITKSTEGR